MDPRPPSARCGDFLIVDDEPGIREGLAAFVRLRGHRVQTAADVAAALVLLRAESFDAVVTDWRLGDEIALPVVHEAVLRAAHACFVMSGHPGEVLEVFRDHAVGSDPRSGAAVLEKPMLPQDLVAVLEEQLADVDPQVRSETDMVSTEGIPVDTAARIELVERICGRVEFGTSDGEFIHITAPLGSDGQLDDLTTCGGDLRVVTRDGRTDVEIRLYRDSRPDGADLLLSRARCRAKVRKLP